MEYILFSGRSGDGLRGRGMLNVSRLSVSGCGQLAMRMRRLTWMLDLDLGVSQSSDLDEHPDDETASQLRSGGNRLHVY